MRAAHLHTRWLKGHGSQHPSSWTCVAPPTHLTPHPRHPHSLCNSYSTSFAPTAVTSPAVSQRDNAVDASSTALVQVANLATAWAKVARRLPHQQLDTSGSEAVDKIISALRLSLTWLESCQQLPRRDGRRAFERAVQLAVQLAELSAAGLPLDADSIAAGVLSEAADSSFLDYDTIRLKLGDKVASLVHDILRVRTVPTRVEVFEDNAASALREWCIAFHDIRANVVEVVCRLDELRHMASLPLYEQQQLALEALQVYAPLGHALGLGAISAAMEDICFQVLFPQSYAHVSRWLRTVVDPAEEALYAAQQQLLTALDQHPQFNQLAAGCVLRARTKSLFSMMKKLLRLGNTSQGGRKPQDIFDLLGIRAVVQPRPDLPPEQAEAAAVQACYIVQEVASQLWHVVSWRTKDYISQPKSNGYRSIHLTVCLRSVLRQKHLQQQQQQQQHAAPLGTSDNSNKADLVPLQHQGQHGGSMEVMEADTARGQEASAGDGPAEAAPYLELQVRTQAMDDRAESGEAAHTAYKGGLDVRQARQLHAWSQELQQRLSIKPHGKLLLPPSVVAQHEGAFSMLDSVDAELDSITLDMAAGLGLQQGILRRSVPSSIHSTSAFPNQQQHLQAPPEDAGGMGLVAPWDGSMGSQQQPLQQTGATISSGPLNTSQGLSQGAGSAQDPQGGALSPAAQLFRFMDRNGDGKVSLQELREQLREMSSVRAARALTSRPAVDSNNSSSVGTYVSPSLSALESSWLSSGGSMDSTMSADEFSGQADSQWLSSSPFGAVSFDEAADLSAFSRAPGTSASWDSWSPATDRDSSSSQDRSVWLNTQTGTLQPQVPGDNNSRSVADSGAGGEAMGGWDRILRALSEDGLTYGEDEEQELDMSLDEFSAFLKQADALRKQVMEQQQQGQQDGAA